MVCNEYRQNGTNVPKRIRRVKSKGRLSRVRCTSLEAPIEPHHEIIEFVQVEVRRRRTSRETEYVFRRQRTDHTSVILFQFPRAALASTP